jgi:gluconokinase
MTSAPSIIVVMGPAGAGKTTIGTLLARSLGWAYLEADDFHSPANVEKMRHGIPLTDADRAPWLASIRDALSDAMERHEHVVLACSALKDEYRDALVPPNATRECVRFVYLHASAALLRERLAHRVGHFAGPALVDSQLKTLEEPVDALWVDASRPPDEIVAHIREKLFAPS